MIFTQKKYVAETIMFIAYKWVAMKLLRMEKGKGEFHDLLMKSDVL